ncbi:PREDICTED: dnaJ homolog subfamily C member 7 homolog [Nelumbo nucifera]|uniref:J domain-containing protein n=2 Tax=Nelumbo nucifera TaxID=4432 RepID=A0A822ZJ85_NELNU|nr:PREDICTED: dnaJ homolog subfamily C member 7 homolog [Nelumbo nucifera]DAD43691.1 TPA_asm: hypothetical protein HUJ06_001921 [Nelumbo nucifera]
MGIDCKPVKEASDGLQKSLLVADYMDQATELLKKTTSEAAKSAMDVISKGLMISPYSEKLLKMKASALLNLKKYSEVIQLCKQISEYAEQHCGTASAHGQSDPQNANNYSFWPWRQEISFKAIAGKLELCENILDELIKNLKKEKSVPEKDVSDHKPLSPMAAGDKAFQSGNYSDAVKHYTAALSCKNRSHHFVASCIRHRASAYKALGQITDAIADCSLAISLDGNYPKANYLRATLYEIIRDYGQAVTDLQRYIYLIQKQSKSMVNQSCGGLTRGQIDSNEAHQKLSRAEKEAKRGTPLDMYLILGIKPSATASDIKKAYHKAFLRHHPDKTSQLLAKIGIRDAGPCKEIGNKVRKDAEMLFKIIGQAYAVLSDPIQRSSYDRGEGQREAKRRT